MKGVFGDRAEAEVDDDEDVEGAIMGAERTVEEAGGVGATTAVRI
jgi:hypothetical protein